MAKESFSFPEEYFWDVVLVLEAGLRHYRGQLDKEPAVIEVELEALNGISKWCEESRDYLEGLELKDESEEEDNANSN